MAAPREAAVVRVLHLLKTAVGARWAMLQMRELVQLGVSVHAALPDGPLIPDYRAAGIDVHLLDPSLPLRQPWRIAVGRQLRDLVASVAPDLVHSHFVTTTMLARLALRGMPIPRVFQVPGPLHLESAHTRLAELMLSDQRDYWIATCEWTRKRYLSAGIGADRVFLAYYGLDPHEPVAEPVPLRKLLGLPPTARLIGMVAHMYPPKRVLGQRLGLKGHEDFIDAIALCRRTDAEIHGVCVGGAWGNATWYERRLREYGASRCPDGVHFLGHRTDVPALYANFDVAVHPSHSENCGGAFESLLHGVPTIATTVGGFPDVVIPEQTGWLVPPRAADILAATIRQVLANPARGRELASAGRARVQRLFTVARTAADVRDHYRTILAHARAAGSP